MQKAPLRKTLAEPAAPRAARLAGPSASRTRAESSGNARPAVGLLTTGACCGALLLMGWRARAEYWIAADAGLGYALGIVGLALMALLLLYSVRKRARILRNAGPLRRWFHVHMMLGLLGPTAIVLHANFQLGSRNSTVALASMLLVSASGIAGRFIYTKIHHEFQGRKATLRELREAAESGRGEVGALVQIAPELGEMLVALEKRLLSPSRGLLRGAWRFFSIGPVARVSERRAWRCVRARLTSWGTGDAAPALNNRNARRALARYVGAIRRAAGFTVYERAFSIWHVLHLPLCVLLFTAAALHVIAVHVY